MELVIDRLTKQFQNKIAVDRVSLRLHNGVFGLLGTNGAGKTTLMRSPKTIPITIENRTAITAAGTLMATGIPEKR